MRSQKYIEYQIKELKRRQKVAVKESNTLTYERLGMMLFAYEDVLRDVKTESNSIELGKRPLKEVRGEDVGQVIPEKVIVEITGHDSWGGPETWEKEFFSKVSAQEYVDEINGKNTEDTVPDYYRTARIKE